MTEKQRQAIEKHGNNLRYLFRLLNMDAAELCKTLRRLEVKAAALTLQNCNVGVPDDVYEATSEKILTKVDEIIGFKRQGIPVFLNGDPRGYALKIDSEWMQKHSQIDLYQDWGGYGIIAPEIDKDGN